jgi:hypothetical protein
MTTATKTNTYMLSDRLDALDARPLPVSGLQELINDLNFWEDDEISEDEYNREEIC